MEFKRLIEIIGDEPAFETGLLLAGKIDPSDVCRQLSRWTKAGQLYQLRRGLYALAPPFQKVKPHPFVIANKGGRCIISIITILLLLLPGPTQPRKGAVSPPAPFPPGLRMPGPGIPVLIEIPSALADRLQQAGQTIPAPASGFPLVDTGASVSAVEAGCIQELGVQPVGIITDEGGP